VRRKLAEIYLLAGDVLGGIRTGSEGSTRDALACFQRALSILTELQSTSAVDGTLTSDLARAHIRVADCLREDNTINGAREHYEAAVTLLRAARARDPRNDRSSKLLATALDGWADIALSFGRADEALAHFDEAEQLRAQLLQASPQDADLRRALSVSHGKLGKVLADSGKLAEALQRCEAALAMRKQLAEWSPDALAKRDLVARTSAPLRCCAKLDARRAESHVVAAVSLAPTAWSDPRDMRDLLTWCASSLAVANCS
jgi:tetratricopeptide (TPR) repeat protein